MGQKVSSSSGKHAILRNDIAESSVLQQFYPILAASLQNGTSTRPGLPMELVIYIMRLADCVLLSMYTRVSTKSFVVQTSNSGLQSQTCLLTDPVSKRMLSHLARMRLTTNSHDQGWCNDPSNGTWTWFEISLVERDEKGALRVKKIMRSRNTSDAQAGNPILLSDHTPESRHRVRQLLRINNTNGSTISDDSRAPEYTPLSWVSHYNRQASSQFTIYEGVEFGPDHEIWSHISEGDRILVRAFAQYAGWTNHVDWSVLRLWEWYDPTSYS